MENVILIGIFGGYAALAIHDAVSPARQFPRVRWWRTKGTVFLLLYFAVATAMPMLWDAKLAEYRLIDATGLGTLGGAAVGLLAAQLIGYLWHRSLHRVPLLWRWFHQVHHSAERVDVFGAFYFHPLDMIGFTFVSSLALVLVVGVTGEAAAIAGLTGTWLAMFTHTNIRTPRWLGYIIQRPENHALHHERGVHAHNYCELALWDMLFGTWRNPAEWNGVGGFYDGSSRRLGAMLIGRDISQQGAGDVARP